MSIIPDETLARLKKSLSAMTAKLSQADRVRLAEYINDGSQYAVIASASMADESRTQALHGLQRCAHNARLLLASTVVERANAAEQAIIDGLVETVASLLMRGVILLAEAGDEYSDGTGSA